MTHDRQEYRDVNRKGWAYLAQSGCDSSRPYGAQQLAHAREWLDGKGWIDWDQVREVLCLAAGGGQQALLFAALGCRVSSLDLSPEQLERDREAACRHGLEIECIEGDMLNLSSLSGRQFDLVYQAVSACYVPDVRELYREVARVVRPGGWYRIEHWNPVHLQLADMRHANGSGYRIVRPQRRGEPIGWVAGGAGTGAPPTCVHFIHPMDDLVGGLCDAGFEVLRYAECRAGDESAAPGTHPHLAAFLPPFFTLYARRLGAPRNDVSALRTDAMSKGGGGDEIGPSRKSPCPARVTKNGAPAAGAPRLAAHAKRAPRPRLCYFICTTPRSGSWLLSESLESTQIAGRPREFFLEAFEKEWFPKWGVSTYAEYLERIFADFATPGGIFGAKFHWYQFDALGSKLRQITGDASQPLPTLLPALFPNLHYIWLTRRDKERQAVSHYKAIVTGQWWNIPGVAPPRVDGAPPPRELIFDYAAIERLEKQAIAHDEKWQGFFADAGVTPLVVVYEEMAKDYGASILRIFESLQIPVPPDFHLKSRLRQQADEHSEQWVRRYRQMKQLARAENCEHSGTGLVDNGRLQTAGAVRASTERFTNRLEIRVAALQRTGQHAIIHWVAAQCRGSVLFLNDVEPGSNPYVTCTSARSFGLPPDGQPLKPRLAPFALKDCLIYNYEDRELEGVFSPAFEENHDAYVGRSQLRHDVVILRDAFNTFASRMSASWMRNKLTDQAGREATVKLWKAYARELLGSTCLAPCHPVVINYNRWCHDDAYRQLLAERLGLAFTDAGFKVVDVHFGGSSFDGGSFDGKANEMAVLERWRSFEGSELYRGLFRDRELVALSEEAFGHIPGTEAVIQ